ncbi:CHAP domain-containing protein [Streptosporangium sp. G12]
MAAGEIGTSGVPNKYTRWYTNDLNMGSYFLHAPWCAIYIAWVAEQVGVRAKVGTDAYTPTWASWYAAKGRWGTTPRPGAMVFFDWGGGKSRSGIDHVGIVEKVHSDGSVTSIEGNSSGRVQRVHRTSSIVGYGYWA